jgi:hypothetical protein
MIKKESILYLVVGLIVVFLALDIFGVFDTKVPVGYSPKEVALMMKVKDLNEEIEDLKIENEIIEKDNERITQNIGTDSAAIYDGSRAYRDSLRAELFR